MLENGIYEELINLWISREIKSNKGGIISTDKIDSVGSSNLLSLYFAQKLRKVLENMEDENVNLSSRVKFVNELLGKINSHSGSNECNEIIDPPELLLSVLDNSDENIKYLIPRPATSIAYSSLFTGSIADIMSPFAS